MAKLIAIGILLVMAFATAFAPAGLSRLALDRIYGVTLQQPSGTLWAGRGRITALGAHLGTLSWDLRTVRVLAGTVTYDFSMSGPDLDLTGLVQAGWQPTYAVTATGRIGKNFVNQLMAPYDIQISGDLNLNGCRIEIANGIPYDANGTVGWGGGRIEYILAGYKSTNELPALVAHLGTGPRAVVHQVDEDTPLIIAELGADGFAKVALTQRFTVLLDNPWPGTAEAAKTVLQVEEKLF